jgi:hypothetical protein
MTLTRFTAARASGGVVLIRLYVDLIIVGAAASSFDARMNPSQAPAVVT